LERKCAAKSYMYPGLYCCVYSSSVGHGQQLRKELQILTPASSSRASLARRGTSGHAPFKLQANKIPKQPELTLYMHQCIKQKELAQARLSARCIFIVLQLLCGGEGAGTLPQITLH